jgi:hypothetical protein
MYKEAQVKRMTSGFGGGVDNIFALVGCYTA